MSARVEKISSQLQTQNKNSTDESVASLIKQVGERVYSERKARRLSRRELSELSGVSPRYLVQLEGGEGNISIGLLQRVATALERPIEWFVTAETVQNDDTARLLLRYRNADAATRANVQRLLDPVEQRRQKAQRLCLIGLRGAGKSTLGALLGQELNLPFIELNQEIEHSAGMPVAEVIAMYGQDGYRKLEADTLHSVIATNDRLVLAVAGGVVEEPATFTQVLENFHTIWLKASPTEHMERVRAQGDMRPMAGNPQAMDRLREILLARESSYERAELHLDTSNKTTDASLVELCALINSYGIVEHGS